MQPNRIKRVGTLFGGLLAMGLTGLPAQDAQARPRYEICQSRTAGYQYCRADTRGGVRLQRQLSQANCVQDQSWGFDQGGIWVDQGCRAEFVIGADGGHARDDRQDEGTDRNDERNGEARRGSRHLLCDAQGSGYRLCQADTRGGVRLARQVSKSPCHFNDSWGYERGGVWVNHGCRAEFELGSGYGDERSGGQDKRDDRTAALVGGAIALGVLGAIAANQNRDNDPQIVTCNSRNDQRNYCRVDTRNGVRLHRQLSRSDCRQNQTWGYDRGGIWVDGGCRAEFELH